jgi:hypothetical protein
MDQFVKFTIYSRPGCHLCDEMKTVVRRVAAATPAPIAIEEVDISTDPDLEARYGLEIPVLVVDAMKVAKHRISEAELARLVRARM